MTLQTQNVRFSNVRYLSRLSDARRIGSSHAFLKALLKFSVLFIR